VKVLNFIEKNLRPQAKEAKAYAIKKDLSSMCDILIAEYETILGVYESLEAILRDKEGEIPSAYDEVYLKHTSSLYATYDKIELIVQTVAQSIYENIKPKEQLRYQEDKGLLGGKQLHAYPFESLYVDQEAIMQKLFYESQYMDKQVKATITYFKTIQADIVEDLRAVFRILKSSVQLWQEPYEQINKHREIASDLEFANTRQFVAKVYENVLLAYHRDILFNIADVQKQFSFFEGSLGSSYHPLVQESIYVVQEKIDKQIKMHLNDPLKYALNAPNYEDIVEIVKKNFALDKMDLFLRSRRNYLYKIIENEKVQVEEINADRISYILCNKEQINEKIKDMAKVKEGIGTAL